jgi:hypothetical protein
MSVCAARLSMPESRNESAIDDREDSAFCGVEEGCASGRLDAGSVLGSDGEPPFDLPNVTRNVRRRKPVGVSS